MGKKKITIAILSAIVILGVIYIPNYLKIKSLARENRELEGQIEQIKQVNQRLSEEHQKLLSDPLYLENVAREKLGVARKGEIVYKVLPTQEKQ
ncbi:MAG: septum formation initiator family protein [Candidatus Omnitrophica bacterium]|nr:septum formation initiator family protein [Candidatus Omnitrophota bacterium]